MEEQKGFDIGETISNFLKQSKRVLNVTHKPKRAEFEMIAKATGLGMVLIGTLGLIISIISIYLKQNF